jgi:hypothetical protein
MIPMGFSQILRCLLFISSRQLQIEPDLHEDGGSTCALDMEHGCCYYNCSIIDVNPRDFV